MPGDLIEVEFIQKDSKRFSDTHGWGYAMFDYDAASGTFTPATSASKPPQGHDAKCGALSPTSCTRGGDAGRALLYCAAVTRQSLP